VTTQKTAPPTVVTTEAELRAVIGEPVRRAADKVRSRLEPLHREWIGASRFLALGTAGAHGRCDVSPKGDPAGFVHVLDDTTLVVPERPGNRRVDGYLNVLENPHVGLLFVVPGRPDTMRVNGSARVVSDASWFDDLVVRGHRPVLALEVTVEEVFFHCSKAFLRGKVWEPQTWEPESVPSRARIAQTLERPDESLEALEAYYGPQYATGLY
jgi:PPOX class probable FMN-dependent enzyme